MHISRKQKVESKNKCHLPGFFFNLLHFEPHIDILWMKYKEVDLSDPHVTFDLWQNAPCIKLGSVVLVIKFGWYCLKNLEEEAFLVSIWKKKVIDLCEPHVTFDPNLIMQLLWSFGQWFFVTKFGWYCFKHLEEEAFLVSVWKKERRKKKERKKEKKQEEHSKLGFRLT